MIDCFVEGNSQVCTTIVEEISTVLECIYILKIA